MKWKNKNQCFIVIFLMLFATLISGCGKKVASLPTIETAEIKETVQDEKQQSEIVILYTNDVHGAIDNWDKDDSDQEIRMISYANVAAMKNELKEQGKTVYVVDAGDHLHGSMYAMMDDGHKMIDLMNQVGYDVATIGEHDMDYGMLRAFSAIARAKFPYISCNFYEIETDETVLPPYYVVENNDAKVAFVGISNPKILSSVSTAEIFDSDAHAKYAVYGEDNAKTFYKKIQKAINMAKKEADYVIALGHTGTEDQMSPYRSIDIIEHVKGLDAYIDAHSHTSMEMELIEDAEGRKVPLTQTGCNMDAIGQMTISEKGIQTQLITEYQKADEQIATMENEWIEEIQENLGEKIAIVKDAYVVNDIKDENLRVIQRKETNLTDLAADSIYYFYNEIKQMHCDVAFVNGGDINEGIPAGNATYESCLSVYPYGNEICMIKATGQNVLDALEWASADLGKYDENHQEVECATLLHAAGLKYVVDTSIENTCVADARGMWSGAPTGEYRVKNVEIYNRETACYEPLDLEKEYFVAGSNYLLCSNGGGLTMFEKAEKINNNMGEDDWVLAEYIKNFKCGDEEIPVISTQNSPLFSYRNYLIDYENVNGSGRLKRTDDILTENPVDEPMDNVQF